VEVRGHLLGVWTDANCFRPFAANLTFIRYQVC